MADELSTFEKLDGIPHIYAAHNNKLRCSAIALPCGSVCLLNPVHVESVEPLFLALPKQMTILYPQGLKTGEIWIGAKSKCGSWWFVGDAFCSTKPNKAQTITEVPELLGTFPRFGVADKKTYLEWVNRQIAKDKPTTIVPCHGRIISSPDLADKLFNVINGFP